MRARPALLVCLASLLALSPTLANAGGFHISIMGARRTGMGANLASPDDPAALFHNPAGLAEQPGRQFMLSNGLTFLDTDFHLQALDPQRFPEVNPEPCGGEGERACPWPVDEAGYYRESIGPERYLGVIPYFGATQDLGFAGLPEVVASLALYAPGAYGAYLPEDAPTAYYALKGLFLNLAATAGAGWRVSERIVVGASLSFNYRRLQFAQKYSTVDLMTPAGEAPDLQAAAAQAGIGDVKLDFDGRDLGLGWGVGVLARPTAWLAVGLAYAGFTAASFEGPLTLSGLGSPTFGSGPVESDELRELAGSFGLKLPHRLLVEMPIPPFFGGGITVTPASWIELAADLRLWLYTLYERQRLVPRYDADAPGTAPLTEASLSKDKGYSNSFDIAFGVLVRPFAAARDVELMLGATYDKSPVPDRTYSIDNPSMNQLSFCSGVRARVGEGWRVALTYIYDIYLERDVTTSETSPPTNVRGRGVAHIPTLEVVYAMAP